MSRDDNQENVETPAATASRGTTISERFSRDKAALMERANSYLEDFPQDAGEVTEEEIAQHRNQASVLVQEAVSGDLGSASAQISNAIRGFSKSKCCY